ncbi:hypothetical protein [Paraburkholderia sp. RL17-337-BIB-A]|uniref:hypothetical protein n=1 Tax=Paraburkholderia sp. RL17-337-BIB-A TaxID=3031636 RepID=UPI0038B8A56A
MSFRSPMSPHTRAPLDPGTLCQDADGELDTGSAHTGRTRRPRYGDTMADTPIRATTGAIAVSFAIVSRKHWPR